MPKAKRFQNLLKSVMGVPPSTESEPSNANSEPETTSQFSPSFYATTLPNPSFQERSLPAPPLLGTRRATFSFQRASSLQAAGQETPSFKATRQETPSFQATRQETSSFQGTSLRAPSLQAVGQQNPSFQTTRQTTSSFRATRQSSRQPSHSFQDQSSSSINDTSQGAPSNPMPPQSQRNKRARESTHHCTVDGIDSQGNVKRLKLKTNEVLSLPQGVRVVVQFDSMIILLSYSHKLSCCQRMCQRNAENQKKLTDPHGGGSKSNARRRGEIIVDTGRRPGRA